jgi:hypothetical protein
VALRDKLLVVNVNTATTMTEAILRSKWDF